LSGLGGGGPPPQPQTPNPQSPIPNPQFYFFKIDYIIKKYIFKIFKEKIK